eukprot:scaffold57622_cov65-Attheya_sp.AAC.1
MTLFTLHYRRPIFCCWEGVTILKQLTGLEYTRLCPSSLFNTAYVQGAGRGGPRTYYVLRYARLPEEVMILYGHRRSVREGWCLLASCM